MDHVQAGLQRYAKDVLKDAEENITTVDTYAYIIKGLDTMKAPNTTLHVCERNVVCPCPPAKPCCCDSDTYYTIHSLRGTPTSNHSVLIDIAFDEPVKLNPSKNLRFFTLHRLDDTETPVMDVIRLRRDVRVQFPTQKPALRFHIPNRRIHMAKRALHFALDYMMFDD